MRRPAFPLAAGDQIEQVLARDLADPLLRHHGRKIGEQAGLDRHLDHPAHRPAGDHHAAAAAAVTPYILSKDKDFTQLLDSCPDLQLIRPRHWKATAVEGQVDEVYGLETVTAEDVAEK